MFKHLIISFALVLSLHSSDEEINHLPFEYMNVQYAGYIGFLSVGGGNTFFDGKYDLEFYIGVTPRFFGISEISIYTFALKNNYIPFTLQHNGYNIRPYFGVGMLAAKNSRYDPNWQDEIDSDYYYQNNWHISVNTGININKKLTNSMIDSLGIYVEAVALDTFLQNYYLNYDSVEITDTFSLAIGVRIEF